MNAPVADPALKELLHPLPTDVLSAIIVGSGFGGIGMAVELRKRFIQDFVVLEKSHDVGGVWRDNTYPGAACDVPSHLYSFSFEPNPNWSRTFSPQAEIYAYLQGVVDKYKLREHFHFGCEVAAAQWDEANSLWQVELRNGQRLRSRILVTAMGQLSRPIYPKLKGIETFQGKAFHSAQWDHSYSLSNKRVAVVGTGASAIQFVPAIAPQVAQLKVFQRTASYILPRVNREYSSTTQALFKRFPLANKALRAGIYATYESRALAFTRFKGLMKIAAAGPFQRMLNKQIKDPVLKQKLQPNYPAGCKRLLLSSEYLKTFTRPNVDLITEQIDCVYEHGIQTRDGQRHEVDAIVYGTGFAATDFLAPLHITGRNGQSLKQAWKTGAKAHLGMTVPGFPNLFMLYGPNTNLGHNSIVYMLESQIRYVARAFETLRNTQAQAIDTHPQDYQGYVNRIQKALDRTVWNGCTSWYIDENGYNSVSWPGFTLSYRFLTSQSRFGELQMTRNKHPEVPAQVPVQVHAAHHAVDNVVAKGLSGLLSVAFKLPVGKPFPPLIQRNVVKAMEPLMIGRKDVTRYLDRNAPVPTGVCTPQQGEKRGAVLYLHGGAYTLGSSNSHRAMTTELAHHTGFPVYTPEYRLAPEHPYPAALEDALASWQYLRAKGYAAHDISVSGDSAGAGLAVALVHRLIELGEDVPASLALVSPFIDLKFEGSTIRTKAKVDPMIRLGWLKQAGAWFKANPNDPAFNPLQADLKGFPPVIIQVGEDEVLLSDSTRLAERLTAQGVPCQLHVFEKRWHVFHLQSFFLQSARKALLDLAQFMGQHHQVS